MLERLHLLFETMATRRWVMLLAVTCLLCIVGFSWRQEQLGDEHKLLDGRLWYSAAEINSLFDDLGEDRRKLYAVTEMTLDLAFPLSYGALFAVLIARLHDARYAQLLLLFPLATALADVLENGTIAYLAWNYDGRGSLFALVPTSFTTAKWALVASSILTLVVGAIKQLPP